MVGSAAARRLRAVFDMYEFGERMYRARLRRERPDSSDREIDDLVRSWRLDRPGAPLGDGIGHPSHRFE